MIVIVIFIFEHYLRKCCLVQVNYFPSRYDPVRHAEKYPTPPAVCAGKRERVSNQLKPLKTYSPKRTYDLKVQCRFCSVLLRRRTTLRSLERDTVPSHLRGIHCLFFSDIQCIIHVLNVLWFDLDYRQERFIRRWIEALSDPRITHEIRSIWISYWSQVYIICRSILVSLIL